MTNIKLVIAYDGTRFSGWQVQPQRPTVQGLITDAIARITGQRLSLNGSGRTDAGAHARGQVANFHVEDPPEPAAFRRALNSRLPPDIRVRRLEPVDEQFHARRDARAKLYRYQIYTGPVLSPFHYRYYCHYTYPLQDAPMQEAAAALLGEHDFAAFAASAIEVKTTVRTLYRSEFRRAGHRLFYWVEGSGFLQHMVRNIVGTLLQVGGGKREPSDIARILAARRRTAAGPTAPARGLFLVRVTYDAPADPGPPLM